MKRWQNCEFLSNFLKKEGLHIYVKLLCKMKLLDKLQKRRSRWEVFCKKGVLVNFTKFTGKHLCWSLIFNKVAGLRPESLLKNRLQHRCFPLNLINLFKNRFLKEHP